MYEIIARKGTINHDEFVKTLKNNQSKFPFLAPIKSG
jgi:hypothetical protein